MSRLRLTQYGRQSVTRDRRERCGRRSLLKQGRAGQGRNSGQGQRGAGPGRRPPKWPLINCFLTVGKVRVALFLRKQLRVATAIP